MKALLALAAASAWHRRAALALVAGSVALSTLLLLGVERLRSDVRQHFAQSVSGTDLIVGPRSGDVQLLLYTVFRIGAATQNMRWSSVQALAAHPRVAWAIPISLGDSHRGYPVVATSAAYFEHFRHGEGRPLAFTQGRPFAGTHEAVLGAEVAARLGEGLGASLVLRHGSGEIEGADHADQPFTVVGVLARTGTPVDRSVHIRLDGMEALHRDPLAGLPLLPRWRAGAPAASAAMAAAPAASAPAPDLTPRSVTAVLLGLKSRAAVFAMQREVAAFTAEPLMGVLPGVALDALWEAVDVGEQAMTAMSALVGVVSLAGLVAVVLTGLAQRRRELAVLRAVGAGARSVFALLLLEGLLVTAAGAALGVLLLTAGLALAGPWLSEATGIHLQALAWTPRQGLLLAAVLGAGVLASLIPGWHAYRLSLADGLQPRA